MLGNLKTYDCIVVGAGIVGAACARELFLHGQKVLVLDSSFPSAGATGACMGHIVVMDDSPSMLEFTSYSRKLWNEIADELPAACEDEKFGTVWVAEDDEEMAEACHKKKLYENAGVACELVTEKELQALEPNLKSGLAGGLRVFDDRVGYPASCVQFFLKGIDLKVNSKVVSLSENKVTLKNGESFFAQNIIVAAGVLSKELLNLPVEPKKGHLLVTERYPGFANHQLIELGYVKKAHADSSSSFAFNIQPRKTGQMIIGSSREFCGYDKKINKELLSQMLLRAKYFMPGLSQLKALRVWTGFRPATHDGLPYIGFLPEEKVYVCTGHEGLGITTSLASAKMIAAQILSLKPEIDSSPYCPERALSYAN